MTLVVFLLFIRGFSFRMTFVINGGGEKGGLFLCIVPGASKRSSVSSIGFLKGGGAFAPSRHFFPFVSPCGWGFFNYQPEAEFLHTMGLCYVCVY